MQNCCCTLHTLIDATAALEMRTLHTLIDSTVSFHATAVALALVLLLLLLVLVLEPVLVAGLVAEPRGRQQSRVLKLFLIRWRQGDR